jgi:hypothetical protein
LDTLPARLPARHLPFTAIQLPAPAPRLLLSQDGRHVVFGRVLEGLDVVYKVEAEGSQSGTPKSKVVIADSGELPLDGTPAAAEA